MILAYQMPVCTCWR